MTDDKNSNLPLIIIDWNLAVIPTNTEPKIRRQVIIKSITIIVLDVHKNSIDIMIAKTSCNQEFMKSLQS